MSTNWVCGPVVNEIGPVVNEIGGVFELPRGERRFPVLFGGTHDISSK